VVARSILLITAIQRLSLRYDRTHGTTLPSFSHACTIINARRLIKTKL
jgi:hypothetical protein